MSRIKICGLTRMEDIRAVNESGPDYIGFVFAKSKRQVTVHQAEKMRAQLRNDIIPVGVFVNRPVEEIAALLLAGIIDIAQLHGQETEQTIRWLKERTGRQIIKAVSIQTPGDWEVWKKSEADYLLFDQGSGGSGKTYDWRLTSDCDRDYFLAGGLNINNLGEALQSGAFAMDLSGGAETDGVKDPEKIHRIVSMVRQFSKNQEM